MFIFVAIIATVFLTYTPFQVTPNTQLRTPYESLSVLTPSFIHYASREKMPKFIEVKKEFKESMDEGPHFALAHQQPPPTKDPALCIAEVCRLCETGD